MDSPPGLNMQATQGTREVVKGVHVIDTYANIVVVADQRMVVIDSSLEPRPGKFFELLKRTNVNPRDFTSIIVTHTHPDHVTGLAAVKQELAQAKVAAHEIEAPYISKQAIYEGPPGKATQKHTPVPIDVRLRDGQAYEGFEILHTPGHTLGHISLYDRERRLLIAGDAVRTEAGLSPMEDQFNIDPRQHRESIRRLARLDVETLVCGHGPPMASGAGRQLADLVARL